VAASRSLHASGWLTPEALVALAGRLEISPRHTAETGAGASTLLFSHLSPDHTVFTISADGSMRAVRANPLPDSKTVRLIEGPTQKTLPIHTFPSKLQAVLLDGPHAYPFPDLEYLCFYPHIEAGGLLVIDDIHIPSVHHLYRFLRKEAMFDLLEVRRTTAFFVRTDRPLFDPCGDGWWLQGIQPAPAPAVRVAEQASRHVRTPPGIRSSPSVPTFCACGSDRPLTFQARPARCVQ